MIATTRPFRKDTHAKRAIVLSLLIGSTLSIPSLAGCAAKQSFANNSANSEHLASTESQSVAAAETPEPIVQQEPIVQVANLAPINDRLKDSSAVEPASLAELVETVGFENSMDEINLLSNEAPSPSDLPPAPTTIAGELPTGVMPLNLPTALSMVGGSHPIVGQARWRVREAYAELDQANALWLPTIRAGFSFDRHDGNYQASDGSIIDVNRNSFQFGLGDSATGAGTTPNPGLLAQFHLADAILQPKIAKKTAWARGHAASSILNDQLLAVAQGYVQLTGAYQREQIVLQNLQRAEQLAVVTRDFSEAGEGLQADASRVQTELQLLRTNNAQARADIAIASARLAELLSVPARTLIVPLDSNAMPIEMISLNYNNNAQANDAATLVAMGLANRPELKESRALVAAACAAFHREKYAPLLPSVLLGFSTGGFGGGLGNSLNNVDDRYDFDAAVAWNVRNLGYGEKAQRKIAASRIQQAKYEKLEVMDRVAREITEASAQIEFRKQQISIAQSAITTARESYELNLARIRDGQGLPIEVLQSLQALLRAEQTYLEATIAHNEAQFQLQWALGWPISAGMIHLPRPARDD